MVRWPTRIKPWSSMNASNFLKWPFNTHLFWSDVISSEKFADYISWRSFNSPADSSSDESSFVRSVCLIVFDVDILILQFWRNRFIHATARITFSISNTGCSLLTYLFVSRFLSDKFEFPRSLKVIVRGESMATLLDWMIRTLVHWTKPSFC